MPYRHLSRAALVAVAPLVLQACATKGFVRNQVSSERARADSLVAMERSQRMAGDSANDARITALRADLDSLRTQFGARIAMVEDGLRFMMPVTFAFDDASVRDADQPLLDRFAKVAQKYYPNSTITVEGYADPAGGMQYNLALSQRRANAVRDALTQRGLASGQLKAYGYGKSRLVVAGAEKDMPGADKNRRVVFVIESASGDAAAVAMR